MGQIRHVSTSNEIEIASNLTSSRAKVFLESRFYTRYSLSNLFNLNPLDIPLTADPGKPPTLPKGMGYVSISHSKDTCIICWNQEKVGVDIECSSRNFNYIGLAEKYFYEKNNIGPKINRYDILKKWSAIEAAIKWDRGKLSKDIKYWIYLNHKKNLFHIKKKIKVNLKQFSFSKWTISIAYQNNIKYFSDIICSNI